VYPRCASSLESWKLTGKFSTSGLVWSGDDSFVRGRGDPDPLWRSSLVESEIKVIGKLDVSLDGLAFVASQGILEET